MCVEAGGSSPCWQKKDVIVLCVCIYDCFLAVKSGHFLNLMMSTAETSGYLLKYSRGAAFCCPGSNKIYNCKALSLIISSELIYSSFLLEPQIYILIIYLPVDPNRSLVIIAHFLQFYFSCRLTISILPFNQVMLKCPLLNRHHPITIDETLPKVLYLTLWPVQILKFPNPIPGQLPGIWSTAAGT